MRKGIFVVCVLVAIVAIITVPAWAKDEKVTTSQGQPFQEIWNAINNLQNKLNNIQLTPGPQGPKGDPGTCSCEVSLEEFNALKARVVALEGEGGGGCPAVPETCNGKDDDCDGTADNGATCGEGQQCVNGQCISGRGGCAGIVDCINACPIGSIRCVNSCQVDASSEALQDFEPLMDCIGPNCIATGLPLSECAEEYCAEQLQSCIGD
jgi:hypothetical protein